MEKDERAQFDRDLTAEGEVLGTAQREYVAPDARMPSQGGAGGGGIETMMAILNMPQAGA